MCFDTTGTPSELTRILRAAASSNDSTDFNRVWELVADRLVILTRRMLLHYPRLHRWEETDDVFQTAAMRLHRSLREVKPDSSARFWALAMTQVRRTLIDLSRHHFGCLGDGANEVSCDYSSIDGLRHDHISRASSNEPITLDDWTQFHQAVERLPDDDRDVFQLTWYAGMSQNEIAMMLQVSVPTVQRRLYRARLQLHEFLSKS